MNIQPCPNLRLSTKKNSFLKVSQLPSPNSDYVITEPPEKGNHTVVEMYTLSLPFAREYYNISTEYGLRIMYFCSRPK
jgi:hypothetical protein